MKQKTKYAEPTADLLLEFFRQHSIFMQSFFTEHKTSQSAVLIFDHIHMNPGTTLSEIARETSFAKSRVKAVIDDFDAKGYIDRKQDPNDQRVARLYLTKSAAKRSEEVCQAMRLHSQKLLQTLPQQSISGVHACLTALSGAINQFHEYS